MGTVSNGYETTTRHTANGIQYSFVSQGDRNIIKIIQYFYVYDFLGKRVYNLGFGDYDPVTDEIYDLGASNNGDHYRVFYTVLNTIPLFFATYPDAMMVVEGSDSGEGFRENCRLTCIKKCKEGECRNAGRRIGIYRSYVEKNYPVLAEQYAFFGVIVENEEVAEDYIPGKKYHKILVEKS